jgi:phosphocarrier protein HPr
LTAESNSQAIARTLLLFSALHRTAHISNSNSLVKIRIHLCRGLSFTLITFPAHPGTMNNSENELSRCVTITNDLGLHARSAAKIAKLVQNVTSNVWIIKDGKKVDASSIIDILTLVCPKGSIITIKIDDQSDTEILNDLVQLIESGFGE